MLQSLSFRDEVVSLPTRPTEVTGRGGHPYSFPCIVRHVGGNNAQATVRFGKFRRSPRQSNRQQREQKRNDPPFIRVCAVAVHTSPARPCKPNRPYGLLE